MVKPMHFIDIVDHSPDFLRGLLDRAIEDKRLLADGRLEPVLNGKVVCLYFEKPSLRTRVSFEVAVAQLGGVSIYLTYDDIKLGKREPIKDIARSLSRMADGFVARIYNHADLLEFAKYSSISVVNALTDYSHPCQAMADVMTIKERFGYLEGINLVFVGDGNNVARSLAEAAGVFKIRFTLVAPRDYQFSDEYVLRLKSIFPDIEFHQTDDPKEAIGTADIIYTDTWVSMGLEAERERRIEAFKDYQVSDKLLSYANPNIIVMHCLPAYRGYEITDEVIESERSVVFDQAENRLHFQRTLLATLLK